MKSFQHSSCNDVLGAPSGVPIEECRALPIQRVQYQDNGEYAVRSYWRPDEEELEMLKAGGCIRLEILGKTHAPLILTVTGRI